MSKPAENVGSALSMSGLEAEFGNLPVTWTSDTGGGGKHYLFRYPEKKLRNKVGFRPGLDIRADGGYIIAPPSLHKSGRRYEWNFIDHPDEVGLADAPAWLLDQIGCDGEVTKKSAYEWRKIFCEPLEEGERNQKITSFAGHLLRKGVDPYVTAELLFALNDARGQPPLDDEEVFRSLHSIVCREMRRRKGGAYERRI